MSSLLSVQTSSGAAPPPRLEVVGIQKAYGSIQALRDFSLTLRPGEIHALCGHNGAGKSTVVKVLSGLVRPDAGRLLIDGGEVVLRTPQQAQRHGVAVVDQEISLIDVLSVADNVLLGNPATSFLRRRRSAEAVVRDLLARVGLDDLRPSTLVGALSLGERQLVEIARALGRQARTLVLDEPTATLSEGEIEQVFRAVRSVAADGTTVVFVSHRLGEVLELCDGVTVLRDGEQVATASTAQLDRETLIELMLGHQPERVEPRRPPQGRAPILRVRDLEVAPRVEAFALDVAPGEVVALAGQVGSGATDVLRALAGLTPGARGHVTLGGRRLALGAPRRALDAGLAFLSNDRKSEGLFLRRSVADNLVATRLGDLTRAGILRRRAMDATAASVAERLGLGRRRDAPVGTLSGGNQQKVFLGRSLERPDTTVLLLDEPTRGVDVGGRAAIHALVRAAADDGVAVVFASSELDEILDLADVVVTMFAGRIVAVRRRAAASPTLLVAEMTHAGREQVIA